LKFAKELKAFDGFPASNAAFVGAGLVELAFPAIYVTIQTS
jgi:hypothetical protein